MHVGLCTANFEFKGRDNYRPIHHSRYLGVRASTIRLYKHYNYSRHHAR